MTQISFRDYEDHDESACLALFDGNTPRYFAAHERADFLEFLTQERPTLNGAYYVLLKDDRIAGCGGYHVDQQTGTAKICWGMVDQSLHRMGLGKRLLQKRLVAIGTHDEAKEIHIDTSQHSAPFFERFGFTITDTQKDGYGPGIDHVEMVKRL